MPVLRCKFWGVASLRNRSCARRRPVCLPLELRPRRLVSRLVDGFSVCSVGLLDPLSLRLPPLPLRGGCAASVPRHPPSWLGRGQWPHGHLDRETRAQAVAVLRSRPCRQMRPSSANAASSGHIYRSTLHFDELHLIPSCGDCASWPILAPVRLCPSVPCVSAVGPLGDAPGGVCRFGRRPARCGRPAIDAEDQDLLTQPEEVRGRPVEDDTGRKFQETKPMNNGRMRVIACWVCAGAGASGFLGG